MIGVSPVSQAKAPQHVDPETFATGHSKPPFETPWNISCGDRKPPVHGVKPLHVRKGKMHACKIREPRDAKRWTLVAIGYDLGTRPALRAALAPAATRRPHRASAGRSARKRAIRPQRTAL